MNIIPLDVETTTIQNGNPFHPDNKLCLVGIGDDVFDIEYTEGNTYGTYISNITDIILSNDLIVGFNIKFDYHWLHRYDISVFQDRRTWDCQLVHFIQTNQREVMPSLNQVSSFWGLGQKIDTISEYWDKGIDTPDIPYEELKEYLLQDLNITKLIYEKQLAELKSNPVQLKLCSLVNQDLIVLEEMEWNGIKYDFESSQTQSRETKIRLTEIDNELNTLVMDSQNNAGLSINWNSGDHLSSILYGGTIIQETRVPSGVYKTGAKAGCTKYSLKESLYGFPQLVKPLKGSELKKEGYYSTSEDVLKSLTAKGKAKKIIALLMERAYLDKLNGTYFEGLEKLYNNSKGENGILHGQFNQCVAVTGRLSSSKPNLQNFSGDLKKLFITRF